MHGAQVRDPQIARIEGIKLLIYCHRRFFSFQIRERRRTKNTGFFELIEVILEHWCSHPAIWIGFRLKVLARTNRSLTFVFARGLCLIVHAHGVFVLCGWRFIYLRSITSYSQWSLVNFELLFQVPCWMQQTHSPSHIHIVRQFDFLFAAKHSHMMMHWGSTKMLSHMTWQMRRPWVVDNRKSNPKSGGDDSRRFYFYGIKLNAVAAHAFLRFFFLAELACCAYVVGPRRVHVIPVVPNFKLSQASNAIRFVSSRFASATSLNAFMVEKQRKRCRCDVIFGEFPISVIVISWRWLLNRKYEPNRLCASARSAHKLLHITRLQFYCAATAWPTYKWWPFSIDDLIQLMSDLRSESPLD